MGSLVKDFIWSAMGTVYCLIMTPLFYAADKDGMAMFMAGLLILNTWLLANAARDIVKEYEKRGR